jgi:glucose-6-phosphate 1-dehydrogenase
MTQPASLVFGETPLDLKTASPCILVIFGATGDLTARKLIPAIYQLSKSGMLPANFACVGFARRPKTHDVFRQEMKEAISKFARTKPIDENVFKHFSENLFYHQSEFDDQEGYANLKRFLDDLDKKLGTAGNRVFYLSTQSSYFSSIVENLSKNDLVQKGRETPFTRVIIEKPFGISYPSSVELQSDLIKFVDESQIYRIDHYLGKETVQNLLVFRFGNALFESLWNSRYIDHVEITVAEDLGVGTRGNLWEESGLVRDIMQNHAMQLLSLVCMEPPASLDADAIRDEKVKVLKAIRPYTDDDLMNHCVRGQYKEGFISGEKVAGYRQENNVNPHSQVETFASLRLFVDNWRWQGVPFYLRSGKRLTKRTTEIAIIFKEPPHVLFQKMKQKTEANTLVIRIQPDEGIALKINCKVPGPSSPVVPVKMDFKYSSFFGLTPPEAYERLILDAILGDSTLFAREDEVFESWKFFDPILNFWAKHPAKDFPNYEAGSSGPDASDALLKKDGRAWRQL